MSDPKDLVIGQSIRTPQALSVRVKACPTYVVDSEGHSWRFDETRSLYVLWGLQLPLVVAQ